MDLVTQMFVDSLAKWDLIDLKYECLRFGVDSRGDKNAVLNRLQRFYIDRLQAQGQNQSWQLHSPATANTMAYTVAGNTFGNADLIQHPQSYANPHVLISDEDSSPRTQPLTPTIYTNDPRSKLSSLARSDIDIPLDEYLPNAQSDDELHLAHQAEFSENYSPCSSAPSSPSRSCSSHTSYEMTPVGSGHPRSSGSIGQQSTHGLSSYQNTIGHSVNPQTLSQLGLDYGPGHHSIPHERYKHDVPGRPDNPPAPTHSGSQVTPSGAGYPSAHNQRNDYALPGSPGYPHTPNQQHSHSERGAVNVHHSLELGRIRYGMTPGGPGHPPAPNQQHYQVFQRGASGHSKPLNESLYAAPAHPNDPLTPRHSATGLSRWEAESRCFGGRMAQGDLMQSYSSYTDAPSRLQQSVSALRAASSPRNSTAQAVTYSQTAPSSVPLCSTEQVRSPDIQLHPNITVRRKLLIMLISQTRMLQVCSHQVLAPSVGGTLVLHLEIQV